MPGPGRFGLQAGMACTFKKNLVIAFSVRGSNSVQLVAHPGLTICRSCRGARLRGRDMAIVGHPPSASAEHPWAAGNGLNVQATERRASALGRQ